MVFFRGLVETGRYLDAVDPSTATSLCSVSAQGGSCDYAELEPVLGAQYVIFLPSSWIFRTFSHQVLRAKDDHDKDSCKQINPIEVPW